MTEIFFPEKPYTSLVLKGKSNLKISNLKVEQYQFSKNNKELASTNEK